MLPPCSTTILLPSPLIAGFQSAPDEPTLPGEIVVIAGGKAVERGSHAKLLAANGVYRKLWDDQSHTPHAAADQADNDDDDDDDDDDEE